MDSLLLVLALALTFLFGWNNSSFLIGNLRGSGTLSFRAAVLISVIGLLLGVLLEGSKMASSLVGSLASTATVSIILATVLTSVIITLGLTLLSLPVSFSMVMVGAFLGATSASELAINITRAGDIVAFWFVAPVVTAVLTYVVYTTAARSVTRFGLLTVDSLNRIGIVASALTVSYTLGANNIGMVLGIVVSSTPGGTSVLAISLILAAAAVVGVVTLGRTNVTGTIGDKMLVLSPQGVFSAFMASSVIVWVGTQLAIPLSISQCLLGGMLGAAFTKNVTVLNRRLVGETAAVWVLAPVVAFALGYILA